MQARTLENIKDPDQVEIAAKTEKKNSLILNSLKIIFLIKI